MTAEQEYSIGLIHLREGKRDEAEGCFRRALRRDAGFPDAHYQLGRLVVNQSPGDAFVEYEAELRVNATHPNAHYSLGMLYASV